MDLVKDLGTGGFVKPGFVDRGVDGFREGVDGGVGVAPRVAERDWVEGVDEVCYFGELKEQRALGDQEADGELDRRYVGGEVE
jgi:hypothetical protein